jgi:hypothetical protein
MLVKLFFVKLEVENYSLKIPIKMKQENFEMENLEKF